MTGPVTSNKDDNADIENPKVERVDVAVDKILHHGSLQGEIVSFASPIQIYGGVHIVKLSTLPDSTSRETVETDMSMVKGERAYVKSWDWPEDDVKDDEKVEKVLVQSVAAVFCSSSNYKIYFQRGLVIHEASYESGIWSLSATIPIPDAKEYTPLTATSDLTVSRIHLFYLTRKNFLHELVWSVNLGWSMGSLTKKPPKVSPYSSLSATCSARAIKVYCQRGSEICELEYQSLRGKWTYRPLVDALPGTSIASTCYPGEKNTIYHVYFQELSFMLGEYVYEFGDEIDSGSYPPEIAMPPYTPLTAISWYTDGPYIRLYYVDKDGRIQEVSNDDDEDWEEYSLPSLQTVEKPSQIVALQQNDGKFINVYHLLSGERIAYMSFSKNHEEDPELFSAL
jgi:hypothetical protein